MKKLLSLLALAACAFSSVHAEEVASTDNLVAASEVAANPNRKQSTGKAASDGSSTANSGVARYVVGGIAVAAAITGAILLSRNSGGSSHGHSHSH
jgi:hypothetical protein